MSRSSVKAALKTTLSGVAGLNAVYTYVPRNQVGMKFPSVVITLEKTSEKAKTLGNPGRRHIHYTASLYVQTIDANPDESASQAAFDDLLDAMDAALRADKALGGVVLASAYEYIDTDVLEPQLAGNGAAVLLRAVKTFEVTVEIIG